VQVVVEAYASGQDPATLVLDVAASSHNTANTIGAKINAAGSASDPWSVSLPGSYTSGQAGYIVGTNLNAAVSTRSTLTQSQVTGGAYALATDGSGNVTVGNYASGKDPATLVLDVAASSHNTANTIGAKINTAATAGDPWATALPGSYASGTAGNILGNKSGFILAANGLDQISVADPGGVSGMTTLPKMLVGLWRYFFKKTTLSRSSGNLVTYQDDGSTANVTMLTTDDGTTQTKGAGA
jgi:hypothetical protein